MARLCFKNKWILVTGASSGLGRAIALYLAEKERANLIITARRIERLNDLKEKIELSFKTKVEVIQADLSRSQDVYSLFERAIEITEIYGVINNAGLTIYGQTKKAHIKLYEKIIDVNLRALINLNLYFLSYFEERGEGAILNITSEGAFIPLPYQSVYSASKHAAQAFTEGLQREYQKSGIVISTFAPGGIATEMIEKSGLDKKINKNNFFNMNAKKVAKKAIKAFKKKKYISAPGFIYKLILFLTRFFPRKVITWIAEIMYRPPI